MKKFDIVVICMVLLCPSFAYAGIVGTWQCGDDCTATLYDNGHFFVSGTGSTYSYEHHNQPWKDYLSDITSVEVEGIKAIGSNLTYYSPITSLKLGNSVTSIQGGFEGNHVSVLELPDYVTYIGSWALISPFAQEIIIPDTIQTIDRISFGGLGAMQNKKIICRGSNCADVAKLLEKYKYNSAGDTIDLSGRFFSADETNCDTQNYYWNGMECLKEPVVNNRICVGGYAKLRDRCVDPLKTFAKKRYTPAEAAQWLNDDNNIVILTFKKQP